jgi:NAD-reducing hydrogenase small subunit
VQPIHEHVKVDAWIPGCPPSAETIWTAVKALLQGVPPARPMKLSYD